MAEELGFDGDFSDWARPMQDCMSKIVDSHPESETICRGTVALVDDVVKASKFCNVKEKIHQLIDASDSNESLRKKILEDTSERWVQQFLSELLTEERWNRENAHQKLTKYFEKAWFNSIGWQMLATTVETFGRSLRAWGLFYKFRRQLTEVLPSYQQRHERMKQLLNQCAKILSTLNGVKILNDVQIEKLELAQEYLNFVQVNIEETVRDLNIKIGDAKRAHSDHFWTSLLNLIKSFVFGAITYKTYKAAGRDATSTITSSACTIGVCYVAFIDFVHAGMANDLVKLLEEEMKTMEDVQKRHQDLCEDLKKIRKETTVQASSENVVL